MTIFTNSKSALDKKENNANIEKADGSYSEGIETYQLPQSPVTAALVGRIPEEWNVQLRRRGLLTSLCCTLLVIWLLMAAFVGGILFYRHLHHRNSFQGWCGTTYLEHGHPTRLEQRLEVDSNLEYERIEVPEFDNNRPAVFIHDFRNNVTAIVDVLAGRCFIKELDRSNIAPPNDFIDLVRKMEVQMGEGTISNRRTNLA